jgi:hypothetical protein
MKNHKKFIFGVFRASMAFKGSKFNFQSNLDNLKICILVKIVGENYNFCIFAIFKVDFLKIATFARRKMDYENFYGSPSESVVRFV